MGRSRIFPLALLRYARGTVLLPRGKAAVLLPARRRDARQHRGVLCKRGGSGQLLRQVRRAGQAGYRIAPAADAHRGALVLAGVYRAGQGEGLGAPLGRGQERFPPLFHRRQASARRVRPVVSRPCAGAYACDGGKGGLRAFALAQRAGAHRRGLQPRVLRLGRAVRPHHPADDRKTVRRSARRVRLLRLCVLGRKLYAHPENARRPPEFPDGRARRGGRGGGAVPASPAGGRMAA